MLVLRLSPQARQRMSGRSKRPVVAKCRSPLHYRSDLAPVALEFFELQEASDGFFRSLLKYG
jgi:hypothetical protein